MILRLLSNLIYNLFQIKGFKPLLDIKISLKKFFLSQKKNPSN